MNLTGLTGKRVLLLYGLDAQTLPVDAECTRETVPKIEAALRSVGWQVAVSEITADLEAALSGFLPADWIVLNLCEGSPAQPFYYARVAKVLSERGYSFTGSCAQALEQTQYKTEMKRLLAAANLPTPAWSAISRAEELSFERFPAIVKPAGEHCSFGITRNSVVFNLEQAKKQAAAVMAEYPDGAMIEEFIDGEEYGVAVWGEDEDLEVLGISVIDYTSLTDIRDRLITFDAKWEPETAIYQKTMPVCPAPAAPDLRRQLEALSRQAHLACGVRDYSRIDLRMRGTQPMILDVNANCALSPNAGFPDTGRIAGWDYAALLNRLVAFAWHRAQKSVSRPQRAGVQDGVEHKP